MITITAPAKINLTLEVLGKRPDGYHEIRSIMQTLSLADTISFENSAELLLGSDSPEWSGDKSLVSKTVALLKERIGADGGASIFVRKRIPLLSGLGGDSSDAASTLIGLNRLWRLGMDRSDLATIGKELGSDVAFFFLGGTVLSSGRGETVEPLPEATHEWILLALPAVPRLPGKTRSLYQALRPNHYTDGEITRKAERDIKAGRPTRGLDLFNTFENVAFVAQPELEVARQHILKMGAPNVHLAGSGPTLYVVCESRAQAEDLSKRLEGQHIWSYAAETLPAQRE